MSERLVRLKEVIDKYINMERLPFMVGVIYMYFDGWINDNPLEVTIFEPLSENVE